ncbi:MAG: sulfite exporter TauE/SafE family protein, partial [Candidatus Binatia bacterium]
MNFTLVFLIGSGGQLLDGMMGMGFGVFSASLLLAVGFPPLSVVPTVNMAKIITGLLSGIAHWRAGNVRRDWLTPFLVPGVIGGIFGAYLLASVSQEKFRFWMAPV